MVITLPNGAKSLLTRLKYKKKKKTHLTCLVDKDRKKLSLQSLGQINVPKNSVTVIV